MQHGLTALFTSGKLPAGASYIKRIAARFRSAVEAAVIVQHGELSLYHAAIAQTAERHEKRAQLTQRYLRDKADVLTPDQLLAFMNANGQASNERDKCLKALGLDKPAARNAIDGFFKGEPINAAAGPPGNHGGNAADAIVQTDTGREALPPDARDSTQLGPSPLATRSQPAESAAAAIAATVEGMIAEK